MRQTTRLVLWLSFVSLVIAAAYGLRASEGKPEADALYQYSTAANGAISYAIVLSVMLAISGANRDLLALRRPRSWPTALGLAFATFIGIFVATAILDHFLHAGREQGLTPSHWEPWHAGAYAANVVVVAGVAPVVEELSYRGLGYSLLARYGRWTAIGVTAVMFALSHGLVEGLPVLTIFGGALAWLRSRVNSAMPGMTVHACFNGLALALAVTV